MKINQTPHYSGSVNTTGCCPKFDPARWDGQKLHFEDKPFVKAATRNVLHVPVNIGSVFARVHKHIAEALAGDLDPFIVLSLDTSAWRTEHLFAAGEMFSRA